MQVTDIGDGSLQVAVQTNQSAATVYLIGHTRQVVKVAEAQAIVGNKAQFQLPKSKLGEGISHLTLFNAAGQPVCERLVAKRPQASMSLQVTPGKDRYATRDNVVMGITASSPTGSPLVANASVSVYKLDSLQTEEGLSLGDYLWLTSDLRGSVESPSYYLSQTGPEADVALDNLLLTHGWRRFRWDDVLNPKPSEAVQPPEHKGHVVLGRVTDAGTNAPAKDVPTYLAIPGKSMQLYSSRSDEKGVVRFELPNFYGTHDLVLQTAAGDSLHRVDIVNPYTETATSTVLPVSDLANTVSESLQTRSLAMQVQNSYFNAYANPALRSDTDSSMFYNNPDERYYLDTY
ncbi:MAG: hypothetical protein EOO39_39690, partial [Cytophagaceae bacterium]